MGPGLLGVGFEGTTAIIGNENVTTEPRPLVERRSCHQVRKLTPVLRSLAVAALLVMLSASSESRFWNLFAGPPGATTAER